MSWKLPKSDMNLRIRLLTLFCMTSFSLSAKDFDLIKKELSKIARNSCLTLNFKDAAQSNKTFFYSTEEFSARYHSLFPRSQLFTKLGIHFTHRKTYNRENPYESSNICFHVSEKKRNSVEDNCYSLCPFCDPFGKLLASECTKSRGKIIGGIKLELDPREPDFYDSLHREYDKHLASAHGIYKSGDNAKSPFVGVMKFSSDFKLVCVCPYANHNDGTRNPCLAYFKINTRSPSGNGFQAYLKHVDSCHYSGTSKYSKKFSTEDIFMPLNEDDFELSSKFMRESANNSALYFPAVHDDRMLQIVSSLNVDKIGSQRRQAQESNSPALKYFSPESKLVPIDQSAESMLSIEGRTPVEQSIDSFFESNNFSFLELSGTIEAQHPAKNEGSRKRVLLDELNAQLTDSELFKRQKFDTLLGYSVGDDADIFEFDASSKTAYVPAPEAISCNAYGKVSDATTEQVAKEGTEDVISDEIFDKFATLELPSIVFTEDPISSDLGEDMKWLLKSGIRSEDFLIQSWLS